MQYSFAGEIFTLRQYWKKSSDTLSFIESLGKILGYLEVLGKFSLSLRKILSSIPLIFYENVLKMPARGFIAILVILLISSLRLLTYFIAGFFFFDCRSEFSGKVKTRAGLVIGMRCRSRYRV